MAETIDVPKVGPVKKAYVLATAGAVGAFVIYRYWAASQGGEEELLPTDPGYEGGEVLPTVPGAYTPGGGGIASPDDETPKDAPPATNYEWSRRAATELSGQGGMEYEAVVDALGAYLARKPLTSDQQRFVQSAIAVMGYPPDGSFQVIPVTPGADTGITVPPSSVKAVPASTTITVTWAAVAGAASYHLYRNDQGGPTMATGTTATMYNLTPGREYKIQVAAVSAAGKAGPKSSVILSRTKPLSLVRPTGLTGKAVDRTRVLLRWKAVPGASAGYMGFRNDMASGNAGFSSDTSMTIGGLKPNTSYRFQVAARSGVGEGIGPRSAPVTVRTKK